MSFDHDTALDAALDAFWQQGFAATSIPAISKATGLSTSSLYNTYGSKLDLYLAVLDRYLSVWVDGLTIGPLKRGTAGLEDLETFLALLDRSTDIDPPRGCLIVNTIGEFRDPPPPVAERTARWRDELRTALRSVLERAAERGEIPSASAPVRADAIVPVVVAFHLLVAARASQADARDLLRSARVIAAG